MLLLPLNRLAGGTNAHFHEMLLPSYDSGDAGFQSSSFQIFRDLRTAYNGQVPYHTSLTSLTSPAGPLSRAVVAIILGLRFTGHADHRYNLRKASGGTSERLRRLLGDCAQERPATTPTMWFCHKCNSGPYNIAAQRGCTNVINGHQCDHQMCNYCRKE